MIVLLKTPKELQYFSSPAAFGDVYTNYICGPWYMSSYTSIAILWYLR